MDEYKPDQPEKVTVEFERHAAIAALEALRLHDAPRGEGVVGTVTPESVESAAWSLITALASAPERGR